MLCGIYRLIPVLTNVLVIGIELTIMMINPATAEPSILGEKWRRVPGSAKLRIFLLPRSENEFFEFSKIAPS